MDRSRVSFHEADCAIVTPWNVELQSRQTNYRDTDRRMSLAVEYLGKMLNSQRLHIAQTLMKKQGNDDHGIWDEVYLGRWLQE